MKLRSIYLSEIQKRLESNPAVALLGPRQVGKTTLAKQIPHSHYFDLENPSDEDSFKNPEFILQNKKGLIVIDEVQRRPEIFVFLRYWIDAHPEQKFLLLGSASQELVNRSSESLAGRISFIEVHGFNWHEIDLKNEWQKLWSWGGFPRSYLSSSDLSSLQWRVDYIRTLLERDIPQLGIRLSSSELRRFWTLLANSSSQILNYAELGRLFGLSDVAVRRYVEVLQSALLARTLKPWHENTNKRQVKRPKIFVRDTGLMHALLNISDVQTHPLLGASWESFCLENIISLLSMAHPLLGEENFYFWRSNQGEEIDLFFELHGRRYGIEVKFNPRPQITPSILAAMQTLGLEKVLIMNPMGESKPLSENVKTVSLLDFTLTYRDEFKI